MKRILFVDDEIPVLEGLRMRLHKMQSKWSMKFVDSGGQALAEFQQQPYDVIVSDVCMPGMSGGRLLRTISERWPGAVRIALSGTTDADIALRLAPVAHQFLSKPCEPLLLENVIDRCLALQTMLAQPALRAVVGRMRRLPPLRETYTKLQAALADEAVPMSEVARIVAADTVIAAKVLQMVNSAFFRNGRRMTNIDQAVAYLGCITIRNLVMSAEVFAQWPDKAVCGSVNLELLQEHTQQVVAVACAITKNTKLADDLLLAALLHDLGYWVLAHECPQELARAHECAVEQGIAIHEAEISIIGASHAQIGAYLLGIWGLPYAVVEAVAHHHTPALVRQGTFDVLAGLVIAEALTPVNDAFAFEGPSGLDSSVGQDYLTSVNAPFSWDEASSRAAARLEARSHAS